MSSDSNWGPFLFSSAKTMPKWHDELASAEGEASSTGGNIEEDGPTQPRRGPSLVHPHQPFMQYAKSPTWEKISQPWPQTARRTKLNSSQPEEKRDRAQLNQAQIQIRMRESVAQTGESVKCANCG
jgi:hypothetical protein